MAIGVIVISGKSIIVPLALAILFANVLLPVVKRLEKHRLGRHVSILLPVGLSVILVLMVGFFMSSQVASFIDGIPALKEKGDVILDRFQIWVDQHVHIAIGKQDQYLRQGMDNLREQAPKWLGVTFVSIAEVATYLVLIPVFTFLTLYYRGIIKAWLVGLFRNGSSEKVNEVLEESTFIAQHYVTGLLIETTIVFGLNAIGFLLLGIQYAIFLALLAAILNLIPYVGIIVANVLCMATTLLTSNSLSNVVWVGLVLGVVQVFDNNVGMPLIVGNKVKINALATVIGVLVGGALCGVPGMFLAIPSVAVLKIICDKVPGLQPWGIVLGDEGPRQGSKSAKGTHLIRVNGNRKTQLHKNDEHENK